MINIDFEGTTAELIRVIPIDSKGTTAKLTAVITNEVETTQIFFTLESPNELFDKYQQNQNKLEGLINKEFSFFYEDLKDKGKIDPNNDTYLSNKWIEFSRNKFQIIRVFMSTNAFERMKLKSS